MRVITLSPGVELTIADDVCKHCERLSEDNDRLVAEREADKAQLIISCDIIRTIRARTPKQVKYAWDEGYNQAQKDIQNVIDRMTEAYN